MYLANMCSHELIETRSDGTASLEALEAEICALASHIHAATCRWLSLVAEFDRRQGWAAWGARSCAHWVAWRCGIAPVSAREHVRVARRLAELPEVRAAFARGELSYSKVRAITRVDGLEREQDMLGLARHATAAQLERLVRAHRSVVAVERAAQDGRAERWLTWDHDDDGSFLIRGRLPAEEGAVLVAALEAARARMEESPSAEASTGAVDEPGGASAEAPSTSAGEARADALMLMADAFLGGADTARTGGDRYQVVVHVDTETLQQDGRGRTCELASGAPLAAETARRIACDSAVVKILERDGQPLSVGRKTRSIPPAVRRALAARDRCCRFPGCTARQFVDAHHIEHWAHGGETSLRNLVQLCGHHHRLLHEGGYTIVNHGDGRLTFRRPDGRRIADCPQAPRGRLGAVHTRRIRPDACISLSHGERMDLDLGVDWMLAFAPPPPATTVAPGI
jgi:hypothetical protein